MYTKIMSAVALSVSFFPSAQAAAVVQTFTFDNPLILGSSAAPEVWYVDRYAPAGFQTTGGRLIETISAADSASNRPPAQQDTFYDTQGRKYDTKKGTTGVTVDLFVASSYSGLGQRIAGLWGTGLDAANGIQSYPIIEYTTVGGSHFQGWDSAGGFTNYGLPTGFVFDIDHTIGFFLNNNTISYTLDGSVLGAVNAYGALDITNVMLQGYNKFPANSKGAYSISWDNLNISSPGTVPEPASLALVMVALTGVGYASRKKKMLPAKVLTIS